MMLKFKIFSGSNYFLNQFKIFKLVSLFCTGFIFPNECDLSDVFLLEAEARGRHGICHYVF